MGFSKGTEARDPKPGQGLGGVCAGMCGRLLVRMLGVVFSLALIGVLACGLLYARLTQGPLRLPGAAEPLAAYLTGDSSTFRLLIGDVVLSLGEPGAPSGLQFHDVEVRRPGGGLLMAAPQVAARFDLEDLLRGDVQPTRIALIKPEAKVIRDAEGKIRIGLGTGDGLLLEQSDQASNENPADAIARVMDGFAGDMPPVPELARLSEISIVDINLSYSDEVTGGAWSTDSTSIRIRKTDAGAIAELNATLEGGGEKPVPLTITAERKRGAGVTEVDLEFRDILPEVLSAQMPSIDWPGVFEGAVSGQLTTDIARDGAIGDISGVLSVVDGAVRLADANRPFEKIEVAFTYEPANGRLDIETMAARARDADLRLSGIVGLSRNDSGVVEALNTQITVHRAEVAVLDVFSETLRFDDGQIGAKIQLDPVEVTIKDSYLSSGDLVFGLQGKIVPGDSAPVTDLRASAINLTVDQLMAHWPLAAAQNARDWIDQNVVKGRVDKLVSHIRIDEGEPQVSLDFSYSDLTSRYLDQMTPVTAAKGRGHLTLHDFYLYLDQGTVSPKQGERITLGPSSLVFRDLSGKVTPAEIAISGEGGVDGILALIDQAPLRLVSKIGLDADQIRGVAQVQAELAFPLLADLAIEQIDADVAARLRNVNMPFDLSGRRLTVAAEDIRLSADTRQMRILGDVRADGAPISLDWRENYGRGPNHRRVEASGRITPPLLAAFGAEIEAFREGEIGADISIRQSGRPRMRIDLDADLRAAELSPPGLDWQKPVGRPGRLTVAGVFGEVNRIDAFELEAADLSAAGSVRLDDDGGLRRISLDRLKLDSRIDIAAEVALSQGAMTIDLTGRKLDLDAIETGEGEDDAPLRVRFDLGELVAQEGLAIAEASGQLTQNARGMGVEVTGRLGPAARIAASYEKKPGSSGKLILTSSNAGALLRHFDIYSESRGGELTLSADVAPSDEVDLAGLVKVRGLQLTDEEEISEFLAEGEVAEDQVTEPGGGLTFRSIRVPFELKGDMITLGDSFAKSPSLAVTVSGEVDRGKDQIDIFGTISPAYAVTGALDDVPLLGELISGGEGEGVFAMTYSMRGPLDDPDLIINPLSLLTPGFLRNIFSGRQTEPNREFLDRIRRPDN